MPLHQKLAAYENNRQGNLAHISPFSDENKREGKFKHISNFLQIPADRCLELREMKSISTLPADLKPGQIIQIEDYRSSMESDESRVHNRIMLILTTYDESAICLTFCHDHNPPRPRENHWLVRGAREPPTEQSDQAEILLVFLNPLKRDECLPPQSEITINLLTPWNIERNSNRLHVRILGEAEPKSMRKLVVQFKHLLTASLDKHHPPSREEEEKEAPQGIDEITGGNEEGAPRGQDRTRRKSSNAAKVDRQRRPSNRHAWF